MCKGCGGWANGQYQIDDIGTVCYNCFYGDGLLYDEHGKPILYKPVVSNTTNVVKDTTGEDV